jgi:hypothetical protein
VILNQRDLDLRITGSFSGDEAFGLKEGEAVLGGVVAQGSLTSAPRESGFFVIDADDRSSQIGKSFWL